MTGQVAQWSLRKQAEPDTAGQEDKRKMIDSGKICVTSRAASLPCFINGGDKNRSQRHVILSLVLYTRRVGR